MKIVINNSMGGYGLSEKAFEYLGITDEEEKYNYSFRREKEYRTDPRIIDCIEKLGKKANGEYADLKIVEIPDDVDFYIDDYYGKEYIHEKHRSWS